LGRFGEASLDLHWAVQGVEELRRSAFGEKSGFFQAGPVGGYIRAYRGLAGVLGEMALKRRLQEEPAFTALATRGKNGARPPGAVIRGRNWFTRLSRKRKERSGLLPASWGLRRSLPTYS
jgi:hypothetical protein